MEAAGADWGDGYVALEERRITIPEGVLPFVGAASEVPADRLATLREMGYVVKHGEEAERCAVRLDAAAIAAAETDVALVAHVEKQQGPLVRFWHWPNGARSALSVTGDLDALSLADYAARLLPGSGNGASLSSPT
jgi:hypothetical protein